MKELFNNQFSNKQHESGDDSDMNESHQTDMLNMAAIQVSNECFNLSDICQPPVKGVKTQHFAPITTTYIET